MKSLELILYDMGEQTKLEWILYTRCPYLMTSQPGSEKMMLVYKWCGGSSFFFVGASSIQCLVALGFGRDA